MPHLRISPRARADLIEIWSYIADDSVANADAFIDRLYEALQVLGRQPGSGRRREELSYDNVEDLSEAIEGTTHK